MDLSSKQSVPKTIVVFVLTSAVLCCVCCCSPVSYREDILELTTTPKMYRDRFTFNVLHKTKTPPINDSFADDGDEAHELENTDENSKVKSVMPGEKTMRESDGDDDDDDDGGEYEGFDYSRDERKMDRKKPQQCSRPDAAGPAMPMMIIRELDMVALQIPVKDRASGAQQEWSKWSPCSRPCRAGRGLQSRWRVQHGVHGKEQQFRPCYLADCGSRDLRFRPSYRRERYI